jgi:hypothetical protein
MKRAVIACVAWLAGAAASARAEPVTVGLFAPSAPFPSTVARVELARRLGSELGAALGATASGRVYARAADFAAAVKRGEVTIALVDPAYLANTTGYTVLAVALHGGEPERHWQLIARGAARVADLEGRRVLVPSVGGREADLVLDVLLGGELGREFFSKIEAAPDTASALAALGLGKADAAVVPVTGDLPPGTSRVVALPALSNSVLVVYGAMTAAHRESVIAAATGFTGDATIAGFRPADAEVVRAVARRFSSPIKRSPFAVLAPSAALGDLVDLVGGRAFAIERTPPTAFTIAISPSIR